MLEEIVKELPNMTEAIRFCVKKSGLSDKQVYYMLGIDKSQWSKSLNNQGYFPHDKIFELMRICENELPLMWLAYKCGYELKPLQSSLEEKVSKLEHENEELKKKLAWMEEVKLKVISGDKKNN